MQAGQLVYVQTDPTTQFTAAISQNAAATLNMAPGGSLGQVDGGLSGNRSCKARLRSIGIKSVEGLDWEVWLWGKDTFATATAMADRYPWGFAALAVATVGRQIAGAGIYYYYLAGLDIPYVDLDDSGEVHLGLIPRSAGKSANASGTIQITLGFEPTLGY